MAGLFSELLTMAGQQSQPQRLLFVFLSAEEKRSKSKHQTEGTLTPLMCVDKLPESLADFETLVAEADGINTGWDFVMISGLSGQDGEAPSETDAEPYLNKMTNDVASGQDLSRYMILDRDEQAIQMMGF